MAAWPCAARTSAVAQIQLSRAPGTSRGTKSAFGWLTIWVIIICDLYSLSVTTFGCTLPGARPDGKGGGPDRKEVGRSMSTSGAQAAPQPWRGRTRFAQRPWVSSLMYPSGREVVPLTAERRRLPAAPTADVGAGVEGAELAVRRTCPGRGTSHADRGHRSQAPPEGQAPFSARPAPPSSWSFPTTRCPAGFSRSRNAEGRSRGDGKQAPLGSFRYGSLRIRSICGAAGRRRR